MFHYNFFILITIYTPVQMMLHETDFQSWLVFIDLCFNSQSYQFTNYKKQSRPILTSHLQISFILTITIYFIIKQQFIDKKV